MDQLATENIVLSYSNNFTATSSNNTSIRVARRNVMNHRRVYSVKDNNSKFKSIEHLSIKSQNNQETFYTKPLININSNNNDVEPSSSSSLSSNQTAEFIKSSNVYNSTSSPSSSPSIRSVHQFKHIHKKRLSRTIQHISSFLQIIANVSSSISFPVTVEKTYTVERLARQIEAEYAFKYGGIEHNGLYEPLEVGLLYDVSMVALRFRDFVGDVLEHGDVVNVLNIYEDLSLKSRSRESKRFNLPISQNNQTENIVDDSSAAMSHNSLNYTQGSEALFQSVLSNTLAIKYFQKFAIREFSVENLLFWLDVELFAAGISCEIEDNYFEEQQTAVIYAKYIYLTYISPNAPLQVNLSDEIRKDIPWPIDDDSDVERNIFDEAQEAVYQLMKGHTFVRYENSSEWKECEQIKMQEPERYQNHEMTAKLENYFRPSMSLMLAVTTTLDNGTDQPPMSHHYKEQTLHSILSQYFPDTVLLDNTGKRAEQEYSQSVTDDSVSTISGYFDLENIMTNAQKMRRIKKEKKLKWLFGEKVKKTEDQVVVLPDGNLYGDGKLSFGDDDDKRSVYSTISENKKSTKEAWNRKKKVDKKLQIMLGEALDENMVKHALKLPLIQSTPSTSPCQERYFEADRLSVNYQYEGRNRISNAGSYIKQRISRRASDSMITSTTPNTNNNDKNNNCNNPKVTMATSPKSPHENKHYKTSTIDNDLNDPLNRFNIPLIVIDKDTKEYRRKKLQKLHQFLGERVPIDIVLGEKDSSIYLPPPAGELKLAVKPKSKKHRPPPLSSYKKNSLNDKKRHLQRAVKLEKLFGEIPPQDLLLTTSSQSRSKHDSISSLDIHRKSIMSLEYLMENDRETIYDLIDYMSDNEKENQRDSLEIEEDYDLNIISSSAPATPSETSLTMDFDLESTQSHQHLKHKQLRLRGIRKLSHFFGATYGQMFPEQVLSELLGELEGEIREEAKKDGEVDKELIAGLMEQIEELRTRSSELADSDVETRRGLCY
nr:1141_t:CDS:2 [Entrophospora candida]